MSKTFARTAALFSAAATLAVTSSAFALTTPAGMGTEGSLTVSADRLFGFLMSSNDKTDATTTLIGIGTTPTTPRVGIDYTVIPKLTIGAAVGIANHSSKDAKGEKETSFTSFLLAPRVGYMIDFADSFGIWPRAGITYTRTSFSPPTGPSGSDTTIDLNLEAPFVLAPANHFAFTAGPFLDLGLSHSSDPSVDDLPKSRGFGLAVGMLGSF
jgi:hypothetical protein